MIRLREIPVEEGMPYRGSLSEMLLQPGLWPS